MREKGVIFCGLLLLVALPNIAGAMDDPYLVTLFSRVVIYALAAVQRAYLGEGG
jgi:hypothetical protein